MTVPKINPRDYIYDVETYPNAFTYASKHPFTGEQYVFEYSFRRNDLPQLMEHFKSLMLSRARQVGFNNLSFDYLVIHYIMNHFCYGFDYLTPYAIYSRAMEIINADHDEKFRMMIWDNDRYIEQVDLFKIHHFDNRARSTSLKMLEFNMRMNNIEDLPFPVGTFLDSNQIDDLINYNLNGDVFATEEFYLKSLEMIEFREELTEQYGKSFINYSDKKIGSELLIIELEKTTPGICYEKVNGSRYPRQTMRPHIDLKNVIFPYIQFTTPEFQRIKEWLLSQRITETNGVFKDLHCKVNNFQFDFGTGGIHGSVDSCIVSANDDYAIIDLDVASYYPNIGIKNRVYPEHLSATFCDIYEGIFKKRKNYPKGTPLNLALKLALNGAYGDSNNIYSCFYDPQYTMIITINGQLMLCMLAEYLMNIPGLRMVQINTDGLTVYCPRKYIDTLNSVRQYWESLTLLELEEARYSRMFIRDVNNYIAEKEDGKLKRKGAYCYETPLDDPNTGEVLWHKNHSSLVVQKAAEAALVRGESLREFITSHENFHDFMLREKIQRNMKLVIQYETRGDTDFPLQNITRYYVSTDGGLMFKLMPPINKKAYIYIDQNQKEYIAFNKPECKPLEKAGYTFIGQDKRKSGERRNSVCAGWKVTPCNNINDANRNTLNYEYYIAEAEKLVNPLLKGEF